MITWKRYGPRASVREPAEFLHDTFPHAPLVVRPWSTITAEVTTYEGAPTAAPWYAVRGVDNYTRKSDHRTREEAEGMVERWLRRRFRLPNGEKL